MVFFSTALDRPTLQQGTLVSDCVVLILGINLSARLESMFLSVDQFSSILKLLKSVCKSFPGIISFMEV